MNNKLTILFDLDGTLINSTAAILESFDKSYKYHNIKTPNHKAIEKLIGYPLEDMYKSLGVPQVDIKNYIYIYKLHYKKIFFQKTFLIDQVYEAILLASTFAKLAVVTNKTSYYSKELMKYFDLISYFEVIIGKEDVKNLKLNKEPVLNALKIMNVTKERVWLIGDTHLDICCAKNAGIKHIAVTSGYECKKSLQKYTDMIFDNAYEAVKNIKKVCKKPSLN